MKVNRRTFLGGAAALASLSASSAHASRQVDVVLDVDLAPGETAKVIDEADGADRAFEVMTWTVGDAAPIRTESLPPPQILQPNPIRRPDQSTAAEHRLALEGGAMHGMTVARMGGKMIGMRELAQAGKMRALNGAVPAARKRADCVRRRQPRQVDAPWPRAGAPGLRHNGRGAGLLSFSLRQRLFNLDMFDLCVGLSRLAATPNVQLGEAFGSQRGAFERRRFR